MIVTLQEARDHLRSDAVADDEDLTLKIEAASQAVLNYLRVETEQDIPERAAHVAKLATLILVGEYYNNREGEQGGRVGEPHGYGYLPMPAVALLFPHRDPALA